MSTVFHAAVQRAADALLTARDALEELIEATDASSPDHEQLKVEHEATVDELRAHADRISELEATVASLKSAACAAVPPPPFVGNPPS